MSYILDAIKKSESERERSSEPEALSMQSGNAYRSPVVSRKLPIGLILTAVLLALLGWLFWPSLSGVLNDTRDKVNNEIGATASNQEDGTSGRVVAKDNADRGEIAQAGATSKALAIDANAELPPANEIQELWQLPADFQARIPELAFSFHVYSSTPEKRTIIINGRRMREGQMVTSKIKLRLITETGVVLHAHNRFFHVDVVEKW